MLISGIGCSIYPCLEEFWHNNKIPDERWHFNTLTTNLHNKENQAGNLFDKFTLKIIHLY